MATTHIEDVDLYMATLGSDCVSCGATNGTARLFMPSHPMHLGNVVILCQACEGQFRPMSIDVFARVAMAKYEREEQIFGFRLPIDINHEFELRRARRDAESLYRATHPEQAILESAGAR